MTIEPLISMKAGSVDLRSAGQYVCGPSCYIPFRVPPQAYKLWKRKDDHRMRSYPSLSATFFFQATHIVRLSVGLDLQGTKRGTFWRVRCTALVEHS